MATVQQLFDGTFDVQNEAGTSLLDAFGGPFRLRETAEAAQRMLNSFDKVEAQIAEINESLVAHV